MYANLLVKEPLEKVMEDWDFLQERVLSQFSTFKPTGQNIYGARRRTWPSSARLQPGPVPQPERRTPSGTQILGPAGVTVKQGGRGGLELNITPGGLPHHVPHSFGYWHINDMDELNIFIPGTGADDPGFLLLIMGVPRRGEGDHWAWYCEDCLTLLFERRYETGRLGFDGFWGAELEAVAAYNSDPRNQVCPECGHRNPPGYGWNAAQDSPEEQLARQLW